MSPPHSHFHSLHAHGGDAQDHAVAADASTLRALGAALALTGGFTLVEAAGGWLADHVDWVSFFALTALLAIPGLALLLYLWRHERRAPRPA